MLFPTIRFAIFFVIVMPASWLLMPLPGRGGQRARGDDRSQPWIIPAGLLGAAALLGPLAPSDGWPTAVQVILGLISLGLAGLGVVRWFDLTGLTRWNVFILFASYVFYGNYNWHFVALLAASTVFNQVLAKIIDAQDDERIRRAWLIGAVATPDRMLKTSAWEASTGKPVTLEDGFWPITGREFSPDGNWKLESRGNQVNIRRSFGATSFPGAPRTITGYHEGILSMALRASPAGNELVVATSQGLEAFDAGSGAARQSPIQHVLDGPLINSMLSPDGRYLATTTFPSSDILTNLYDYLNGISLGRVDACTNRFVVVSNTIQTRPTTFVTNTLLACATDKAVQVIDVATQKPRTSIPVTNVLALAASHDGQRLAISARGLPIMIFDSETGWLAATMTNSKGDDATTMQWTPDDAQLIEVSSSGAVHVWDAKTGKVIRCCIGESTLNNVGAVSALSPDERLLAVAYYPIGDPNTNPDFIIRLWDPATGQSRGSLKGHAAFVSALAFSRDGTRLFSGSYDGTVRAWQLFDAPVVGSH